MAAHCARCHSEQGFLAWLPQLAKGDAFGLIKKPDGTPADVPYLTSLGLTKDKVQPITCNACHKDGPPALSVANDTYDLPAGFKAVGVGAGALCMTCHNTRNGRITWNAADAGRYTAPHESAQAEEFKDSAMAKAGVVCMDCHMAEATKSAVKRSPFEGDVMAHRIEFTS